MIPKLTERNKTDKVSKNRHTEKAGTTSSPLSPHILPLLAPLLSLPQTTSKGEDGVISPLPRLLQAAHGVVLPQGPHHAVRRLRQLLLAEEAQRVHALQEQGGTGAVEREAGGHGRVAA